MPSDIRVIRPHEFLRSTEDGRLDLEETKRLLAEIARRRLPRSTTTCSSIHAALTRE